MTTVKTKVSNVSNLEKGWEIKDRTYVLTNNRAPITWTIQTKGSPRNPLLWFNEETGENREIRLASNFPSIFVDEQKGQALLEHIIFEDGVVFVTRNRQNVQKLLSIYHPLKGVLWEEIDDVKEAEDEVDYIEHELHALNLVQDLDISHLEAIMRTELGSSVSKMKSKELKRDAYRFARANPKLFIELSEDEDLQLRNLANRAVEVGIVKLTDENTVFKFANGKKIMTVPFDQHPYGALAQYFKTDEGLDLMKSITKKLS
jgi:hypothetical protein|tara:strand:+ start:212 stop:991 length:780 start_codon:yes stop_codon:yes gene_type:complete